VNGCFIVDVMFNLTSIDQFVSKPMFKPS